MTSQSITAQARKWSYQTHSLDSVPSQAPTFNWISTIHHAHIMPTCNKPFQQAFISMMQKCTALTAILIITGWPKDIKEVPHPLHLYWQHRETLTIKNGLVLQGEALLIPPAERERVLHQLHQFYQGIMKSQVLMHVEVSSGPGINKAIKEVVCQCETCTWFQSQNAMLQCPSNHHPHHHTHGRCVPQISSC